MQYPTVVIAGLLGLILAAPAQADDAKPKLMRKGDLAGKMLEGPNVYESTEDGNTTLDATSFMSSDERFGSGMYRSGPVRYEVDEPYGVDEFMYFIEGGVTLTSSDGTVQVVKAGEAVTVPKEWTGIWETKGYTKIWVIYSADGSGLE